MKQMTDMDRALRDAADAGEVPGVVAMAATGSEIIYQGAFGKRDLAKPRCDDARHRVLDRLDDQGDHRRVAAMQLVEQGKLALDRPIGEVLPELAKTQVIEGFDATGKPKLRAAKRPITLRNLLTHTAGYSYDIWNADMGSYIEHDRHPGDRRCAEQGAALHRR